MEHEIKYIKIIEMFYIYIHIRNLKALLEMNSIDEAILYFLFIRVF